MITSLFIHKSNIIENEFNHQNNKELNTNSVITTGARLDLTYKIINENDLPYDINNIFVPTYLTEKEIYEIYARIDKESTNYIFSNYKIVYENKEKDKMITISFTNGTYLPRDYYFNEEKETIINETKVIIGKYENSYLAVFKHKDINYNIEANNININDLINILKSIIK